MDILRELVEQFAHGNGVIFIGAALSQGTRLPGWADLVRELAAKLDGCPPDAALCAIVQYYDIGYSRRWLPICVWSILPGVKGVSAPVSLRLSLGRRSRREKILGR